jgi:hypothetical protein
MAPEHQLTLSDQTQLLSERGGRWCAYEVAMPPRLWGNYWHCLYLLALGNMPLFRTSKGAQAGISTSCDRTDSRVDWRQSRKYRTLSHSLTVTLSLWEEEIHGDLRNPRLLRRSLRLWSFVLTFEPMMLT